MIRNLVCRLVGGLFLGLVPGGAVAAGDTTTGNGTALDWLAGCWVTQGNATRETWVKGGDTILFGFNVVTRGDRMVFFEQLRLQKTAGAWTLFAYPAGVGPTTFAQTDLSIRTVTFANPDHDFPQIIRYERTGNALVAIAADRHGGNKQEWRYQPCSDDQD